MPVEFFLLPPVHSAKPPEGEEEVQGHAEDGEERGAGEGREKGERSGMDGVRCKDNETKKKKKKRVSSSLFHGGIMKESEAGERSWKRTKAEEGRDVVVVFQRDKESHFPLTTGGARGVSGEDRPKLSLPSPRFSIGDLEQNAAGEVRAKEEEVRERFPGSSITKDDQDSPRESERKVKEDEDERGGKTLENQRNGGVKRKSKSGTKVKGEQAEREEREEREHERERREEQTGKRRKKMKDERFPLFDRGLGFEVYVHPGDMLYIPKLWWHFVKAESASVSVSHWFS